MNAAAVQSYMRSGQTLPFCPGCGHERLLRDLDKALVRLQLDPKTVVIVTDIGCIGLSDQYFATNGFHGLHGRSLTYATGIKLARPELTVVVLMGDGGCGIGGAHLLNAARRNLDLTLIVANNFNYGMTGGQHSVTTPLGGHTATTPGGNTEGPIDLCAVAEAAGASWVYRGTTYDSDLAERIAQGMRHAGFALLDVWELCTAYYTPRNDMNKREFMDLLSSSGMPSGLLVEKQRPEFAASYGERSKAVAPPQRMVIERAFASSLDRQIGIVIAGSAGQKVKSAATMLARAGVLSGLDATQKDDYPITVMTGHSLSEVNLSRKRIEYTAIDDPDYFAVISEEGLKKSRQWISRLSASCNLYVDHSFQIPDTRARVRRLGLSQLSKEAGKLSLSVAMVAAMVADGKFIDPQALEKSITSFQSPKVAEANLKAVRSGLGAIQERSPE
jgi:pyruvate/2-oxoacid:ferredoxin oxidoreductase beta subunit/Pyruvate/2-oxoacid:ferredoxin oxidoreductase gamma subunit